MKKILFTRAFQRELLAPYIEGKYEVVMWEEENIPMPRQLLLEKVADVEAIYTNVADQLDEEFFNVAKNLKAVATMGVGYDNIAIDIATEKGIPVGHTPDVLSEAVAELAVALMYTCSRRIRESMDFIRNGQWKAWGPFMFAGSRIKGSTIGIIGMGRIGKELADIVNRLGMKILYHNRRRDHESEERYEARYCSLEELLKQSDVIVMLAPLTDQTRHMLGYEEFSMMKNTAIFINVSRGPVVNEKDLFQILKENKIFAAGLDVFEIEPIKATHELLTLPNVVTTPHIGSATIETRLRMLDITMNNIVNALEGKEMLFTVNKDIYQPSKF
ncbi:D-glycerate dehydrogenase [Psychrobacillus sp. INOP01]|uniref:2-hydroxyacid dehydrogenase n=1 Tax=Psychrobacillus sp. INOP01 TaxID=2829187 RepID=UPI001BAC2FB2|nr:D-glycerate dehydrogenase [Psychrobacillus sp. INOP01]QUG42584.1 D-glycerate dehydrogenase [Psychrobacillus sp. INOP01]